MSDFISFLSKEYFEFFFFVHKVSSEIHVTCVSSKQSISSIQPIYCNYFYVCSWDSQFKVCVISSISEWISCCNCIHPKSKYIHATENSSIFFIKNCNWKSQEYILK